MVTTMDTMLNSIHCHIFITNRLDHAMEKLTFIEDVYFGYAVEHMSSRDIN